LANVFIILLDKLFEVVIDRMFQVREMNRFLK